MVEYEPNIVERNVTYERCRKGSSSTSDFLTLLEQLREKERGSNVSLEARVEILAAITDLLIQAERYTDALESSRQIEELARDGQYPAGKLVGAGLQFLAHCNRKPEDVELIRTYFVRTFRLCQEVANTDNYCKLDEQFIQRFCEESKDLVLLFQLQEFKDFNLWYLSWSKEYMSSIEFLQSGLQTLGADCVESAGSLHFSLGCFLYKSAEKENDLAKMESAMHHLWTSARTFASQQKNVGFEAAFAYQSFALAVGAAIVSKNLDKARLILMEALETTQVRNRPRSKLWHQLSLLADSYETEKRYSEATDVLKTGLTFAQLVEDQEQRTLVVVKIECQLGYSLTMEYFRDPSGSTQETQGLDHLRHACSTLGDHAPNHPSGLGEWIGLFLDVRTSLGDVLFRHGAYQEAFEHVELCSEIHPDFDCRLALKVEAAMANFYAGAREQGLMVCEEALMAVVNDNESDHKELLVHISIIYSGLLELNGQMAESLEAVRKAKTLYCESDFLKTPALSQYILKRFLRASDLSSMFDLVQHADSEEMSSHSEWQVLMAQFNACMLNKQKALDWMELYECFGPDSAEDVEDDVVADMKSWEGQIAAKLMSEPDDNPINPSVTRRVYNTMLAAHFCTEKERKMELLSNAKELVKNEWGETSFKMAMLSPSLGLFYYALGEIHLADEEFESALKVFEPMEDKSRIGTRLGYCYLNQAKKLARMGCYDEVGDAIERARPWVGDMVCRKELASLKIQYFGREKEVDSTQELIGLFVQNERQYPSSMHSFALGNLDEHMTYYRRMEFQCAVVDRDDTKALLWVERSRMRLFMRIAEQQKASLSPKESADFDGDFDSDDVYAEGVITSVMQQLGTNSAVIEYSYSEEENRWDTGLLLIYVVYLVKGKLTVASLSAKLLAELKKKWNTNLEGFVGSVIGKITSMEDGDVRAKEYLSFLHEVLLMPTIAKLLPPSCDTLVFAPHGHLSMLPFHALYDKSKGEYLIQQKCVCNIPSLRTLRHCLERQRLHKRKGLQKAFVAGNPHPMGRSYSSLPAAEKEAIEVAKFLGVEPCVREQMTKEAVIQGLCGSSVVLLATHAECVPGFVVLQGVKISSKAKESTASKELRQEKEMLTAVEISQLSMSAALVVLDGCETGRGEVRWEGVFGLGRSVLQAGASTVILSLWKVNDDATRILVTGMFRRARAAETRSVAESLKEAMLEMIQGRCNIYHWAPLIAMGSHTLRINELISDASTSATLMSSPTGKAKLDKDRKAPNASPSTSNFVANSVPGVKTDLAVVHKLVGCDECKELPIMGPRFKAKATYKVDYDLCLECFTTKGCSITDFDRFDIPVPRNY